nr:MFS transporter [Tissierella sp.]
MKLNYKRTFFVGLAFMGISAFWQLYDSIIPLMLQNTFLLSETLTGTIMALDNVLALLLLPLFGTLSDRVDTRLGKRTPFIVGGTSFAVIFMMLVAYANKVENFWLFFLALGITLIAMGTYRSPTVALMPDLTPKPLRSKANSVINLMGAVGAIITLGLISALLPKVANPDYTLLFAIVASIMVASVLLLLITIKERKVSQTIEIESELPKEKLEAEKEMAPDVKKSLYFLLTSIFLWFTAYNAITTAFSRYAGKVWGLVGGGFANALLVATGAAILSYIPIGIIASKVGRKKTIITGIIMVTASYFAGYFFKDYSPVINIVFGFTGIGWAAINVNSYPMVVEMSGNTSVGKYTGLYYFFSMAAQVFTPIFSGFLLQNVSYRILFPYAFIFSVLSLITMFFVKHGDSKPSKKGSALENFDFDD